MGWQAILGLPRQQDQGMSKGMRGRCWLLVRGTEAL